MPNEPILASHDENKLNVSLQKTKIAFIGCGYVADLYIATYVDVQDNIEICGVFDIDHLRRDRFAAHYNLKKYPDLQSLLQDPDVDIVVNLTNPKYHYELSMQALKAGKHVYSEKPLALELSQAQELVAFSRKQGLQLVCAPSSALGEAAQTMMRSVRDQIMGKPRLVYAEIDDGMIHRIGMERWKSTLGVPWPATDELETGCTLEHAGYVLSWMVVMFGSARRVVSYSSLCVEDRGPAKPENYQTPDFSCACIEFENGTIARITNSIVAPHDHRFRIFCERGQIHLDETWDFAAPVFATPLHDTRLKRQLHKRLGWSGRRRISPVRACKVRSAKQGYNLDFMVGIIDMAMAIKRGDTPRLGGDFSLHITEVSLAIQHPEIYGTDYRVQSSAPPVVPMPWAD